MMTEVDIKRIMERPSGATEKQISSISEELYNQRQTNRLLAQEKRVAEQSLGMTELSLQTMHRRFGLAQRVWRLGMLCMFAVGIVVGYGLYHI